MSDLKMDIDDDSSTQQYSSSVDYQQMDLSDQDMFQSQNESNVAQSHPQRMIPNPNSSHGVLIYPHPESTQNRTEVEDTHIDNQYGTNQPTKEFQEPQGICQSQLQEMFYQGFADPLQYDYDSVSNSWYHKSYFVPQVQQGLNQFQHEPSYIQQESANMNPRNSAENFQSYPHSPPPPYTEYQTNKPMPSNDGHSPLSEYHPTLSESQWTSSMESFVVIDEDENLPSEDGSKSSTPPLSNKTKMNDFQVSEKDKKKAISVNQTNKTFVVEPKEMKLERDTPEIIVSNMIEVSNLPANETTDTISMFFRKKKVTGTEDAKFKILTYNEERRVAVIEFEDKEVVRRLLEKKELKYHDGMIKILPHEVSVANLDDGKPSKQRQVFDFKSGNSEENMDMYYETTNKTTVAEIDDGKPCKQLKVMGFNSKTSKETIDMFFDSKKKSGGVAESINYDHFNDEKYVIVSYDNIEDVDRVLSKEHNLEGSKLEVTKFRPESVPSIENIVQATGFKETSFETLELYFESKKKSGAEAEKVELIEDENCLHVTYSCNEDMETVLQRPHEVQGNKLHLQKLEEVIQAAENLPIIVVTGFKETTSFETLELYFESKKKSGAEAEKVELDEDGNCLYVTYSCNEECDLILNRKHRIENCQLILNKHHPSRKKEKRQCGNGSGSGNDNMVKLFGFKSTFNESKLQNYIENEKKFGAVASSVEFDPEQRCVFVTLSSVKDAEQVCGKQHIIGKETVHVSKYVPPPKWNDRFLIRNISEETSLHKLKDYLEGKLGFDATKILFSDEEDKAVVYCTSDQYDIIFSKSDILRKKKLNDRILALSPVYKSKIVQVSGFTPDTDEEDLEYYFENKKKSKGGDVEKVEIRKEEAFALVHFQEYEDACNVCQTDHELHGEKLTVKEYQKCLGILGGIEDPDSFTQPEPQPISLNDIEGKKMDFIYRTPENKNVFETKMQELDTVVDWNKEKKIVELKLTLPSKVQKGRKLARKWMKNHQSYFKDYMETISYQEFKLLSEVIELVAIELKRPQEKDLVVDVSGSSIIVIGSNTEVFQIFIDDINTIISKIEEDFERKKKELVETVAFQYSYRILDKFGLIKMVQDSSGKLKICNSNNEVQFKGTVSEINSAKARIYEKVESLKNKMITDAEMSPMVMELLLRPEVVKHIIDNILKGDEEVAVWEGEVLKGKETGSLQVVAKDQPSLEKIINIFNESISYVEHKLDPESTHLLTNKKWQIFVDNMVDQNESFIKIMTLNETTISITCISDIVEIVMQEIKTFFEENTIYTKSCKLPRGHDLFIKKYLAKDLTELAMKLQVKLTMDEETVGIKLEGTKGKVEEVLEAVKKLRKSIECREKNIGEKMHKKLLDTEKGSEILRSIEEQLRCVILKEKEEMIESMNEEKELLGTFEINNATIKVIQVDITTLSVDVIVNAANGHLKHIGGVAGAIKAKGGASIQQECDEYVYGNGTVLEGDCMISKAGNLPCRNIIHAVGPMWYGGRSKEDKKLAEVIYRILEMVMTYGYKSVAIPAISTGIFGYPLHPATDIIVRSIARHFKKVNRSSITTIYLIDINDKSLHSFIRSLKACGDFKQVEYGDQPRYGKQPFQRQISETEFEDEDISGEGAYSLPVRESPRPVQESSRPLFKPKLITGEIAKVSADVIVNTASGKLQLQNGAVSSSINKAGGPSLQQECDEKYPNGIKVGDIAVTSGGQLKCKKVYHTCLSQYAPGAEKNLNKLILKCLKSAEKSELQSIAFPAIGTGNLGYPKDVVAKTFYESVNEYKVNGGRISNINIVVYGGDTASVQAFKTASQSSNANKQELDVRPKTKASDNKMAVLTIGELAKVSADVIVNTASADLQLQNGAVSSSINKAGGPSLQQECDQKYPNGIKVGDIAVTSGGKLKCKSVYHTCLSQYAPGAEKFLERLIMECLVTAEEAGFKSIAFPAIGTGNLGYPKDVVAQTFYESVNEYKVNGGSISNINLVVYGGDTACVKAFQFIFHSDGTSQTRPQPKKRGKKKSAIQETREDELIVITSSEMVKGIDVGKFKLIVRSGDILSAKVPIIVDSTNRNLFPTGAVSKAIYKVYGKDIDEIKSTKETDMHENGIAVTPINTGNSNIRYIIHVNADRYKDNWKKAIILCLKEADDLKQNSIAFPALGTGNFRKSMEKVAESFYKALSDTSINMKYLKTVEIVIFQSSDLDLFVNGFTTVLNEKKKKTSFMKGVPILGSLYSYFTEDYDDDNEMVPGEFEDISEPLVSVPSENLEDISLSFYSDNTNEIEKAMDRLDKSIKLEVQELKIPVEDVTLTDSQKRKILSYEESHSVVVKIDERLFTIVIRGLMADISEVNSAINSILRNALTKEHEAKYSTVLKDVIQWSSLEKGQRKVYPKYANTKIEEAYGSKDVDFELKYSNQKLKFDFIKMEVTDVHGNTNPLLRQDKIKEATEATGLPKSWTLKADANLNIVLLNSTSAEYKQVESNFMKTGQGIPIIKIERIENRSVYQQYMAKKKQMELELKSMSVTVEQPVLWHGTDQQAVDNINNYGFNRSYCGKNATVHGQGVYFAVTSSYSVNYAPGSPGQRQMYQCKVLVGQYAQGNSSYRVPPAKAGGGVYESLVDNVSNPSMYVIFHDTQAYPEYLITF